MTPAAIPEARRQDRRQGRRQQGHEQGQPQGQERRTEPHHELWALFAIAQRDLIRLLRDRYRLALSLAFPLFLIVGVGNVVGPLLEGTGSPGGVTFVFTGILAATLFQSAAAGIVSIVEDRETDFSRELFVAPVSRITIVAGKVVGESLVAATQGVGIVAVAPLLGVRISLPQALALVPPGLAACLLGAAFGLATVAWLPSQRTAMQVFTFLIVPQYVLAGVVAPVQALPAALDIVSRLMPLRYAVDLLRSVFDAGSPGLVAAAPESPIVDVLAVSALVVVLMGAGTWAFDRRERSR